jgi:hypothetical protein
MRSALIARSFSKELDQTGIKVGEHEADRVTGYKEGLDDVC